MSKASSTTDPPAATGRRAAEEAGVVRRRTLPPPAASKVYELTEWGQELAPVLVALGRWEAGHRCRPESANSRRSLVRLAGGWTDAGGLVLKRTTIACLFDAHAD
jgi:hypothetical protein